MARTTKRRKPGPTPWLPPDLSEVENLAAHGLTRTQIAAALGISAKTLARRRADSRKLDDAILRGQAKGIAVIANKVFEAAQAGNVAAAALFLKCRAGWRNVPSEFTEQPPAGGQVGKALAHVGETDAHAQAADASGPEGPAVPRPRDPGRDGG